MPGLDDTTLAHHDTLPGHDPIDESARRAFDGFRLEYRLGEGGMGEVWLAEQLEPVRRKVALKVIKAGMDSKEVVARFESERQALAMMDHPAIARIFDGGTTPEGRPYVVMEYVPGLPITEHCDTQRLSTAERIELGAEVCDGKGALTQLELASAHGLTPDYARAIRSDAVWRRLAGNDPRFTRWVDPVSAPDLCLAETR